MPPIIDQEKCTGCGVCASICPMRVFARAQGQKVPDVRYGEECWHCLACEMDCKYGAIKVRLALPLMMPYVEAADLHTTEHSKGGCHA